MKNLIIAGAITLVTLNAVVIARNANTPVVASTASASPTDDSQALLNALEVGYLPRTDAKHVTVTSSVIKVNARVIKYGEKGEARCGEWRTIGTGGNVRDCVNL